VDERKKGLRARTGREIEGVTLSEKRGRFEIFARAEWMGSDLLVTLWGGVAHIGALGMAAPRPSLRDPKAVSATSSVFTFPGHKEDVPAKVLSEALSSRLNTKVVVDAGIHWDNAQPDELRLIMEACVALKDQVLATLTSYNRPAAPRAQKP
jgi:gallate decarboxylase subunit D